MPVIYEKHYKIYIKWPASFRKKYYCLCQNGPGTGGWEGGTMFHLQTFLDENSYKPFCIKIEKLKFHIIFAPILIVVKNNIMIFRTLLYRLDFLKKYIFCQKCTGYFVNWFMQNLEICAGLTGNTSMYWKVDGSKVFGAD